MKIIGKLLGMVNSQYLKIALLIILGLLIIGGLLLVFFGAFSGPSRETELAFKETDKRNKENEKNKIPQKEKFLDKLGKKIGKFVKINVYTKNKLTEELKLIGSTLKPEEHIGIALAHALVVLVGGFILGFVTPWSLLVAAAIAFLVFKKNYNIISKKMKERTEKIELCLARFSAALSRTLKKDRDVISFLKRFKETAPPEFVIELEILIADMESGNQKSAILRSINRVNSQMYSDVMRGLMSVIDGNDSEMFWDTLNNKLVETQKHILEDRAERIPRKLKMLTPGFLVGFCAQYVVVLGYYLIQQMDGLM